MIRQIIAHHYCGHKNEEVLPCVIHDSHEKDTRLIGIENIISEELLTSPPWEKKLWHSHKYEVTSSRLIAPGLPSLAEKLLMKKLVSPYGKKWHTWQVDRGDKLPLGFTADGQAQPALVEKRDKDLGMDTSKKKEARADIPTSDVAPGADAWQNKEVFQIKDEWLKDSRLNN